MEDGKVTILTVTHERASKLRALLGSIAATEVPRLAEVLLVDDSNAPPDYEREFPSLPVRHLRLTGRRFISAAKNIGLAEVRSEFVFVVDDDNVLPPEGIEPAIDLLRMDPGLGAVMPSAVYHLRPDLVWVYATPFLPGRWGFDLIGRNRPRNLELERRVLPTDALPNASLLRRAAVGAGFDERLPVNSSASFCQSMKARGWRVVAFPQVRLRHDVEPPHVRGYWAEHSVDPVRLRMEVHDWFLFQRTIRRAEHAVRLRALYHALPFLSAMELAFLVRSDARWSQLNLALFAGLIGGLREALAVPRGADAPR